LLKTPAYLSSVTRKKFVTLSKNWLCTAPSREVSALTTELMVKLNSSKLRSVLNLSLMALRITLERSTHFVVFVK
jgi:hypothetical protein